MTTENSSQDNVPTSTDEIAGDIPVISDVEPGEKELLTKGLEVASKEAPASKQNPTTTPKAAAPGVVPPVVPAAFQPNMKFKAFRKEYEIDEMFKPLIKDEVTQEKIKKLHEKAYALEDMEQTRDKIRSEYDGFKGEVAPKLRAYDFFNQLLTQKDYDTLFKKLGVRDDDIFQYAQRKLDLMKAPANQQEEYNRNLAVREQSYQQTYELQNLQKQNLEAQVTARHSQLDNLLSRSDLQNHAVSWDSQMGSIGAFRQLVIDEAEAHYYKTGQDLSPEQAVNHVLKKWDKIVKPTVAAPQAQMGQGQPASQTQQPLPIIPAVGGKGASPVKKVPRSLKDLKDLAKQMDAQGE